VKTLKIKKKKAKVGQSHDFVKSNKIPLKVKIQDMAQLKPNVCGVTGDVKSQSSMGFV
jgi:hypothetical protein